MLHAYSAPHCITLHRTAPHCTTLHHTAPHCTTLCHPAQHYATLQHTTTHYTTLTFLPHTLSQRDAAVLDVYLPPRQYLAAHTATHCTDIRFSFLIHQCDAAVLNVYLLPRQYLAAHTATHCTILTFVSHTSVRRGSVGCIHDAASISSSTHCNTLQHTDIRFSYVSATRRC